MNDRFVSRVPLDAQCRGLLEQLLDAVLLLDPDDGGILFANQAAADAYGRPREELIRLRISDLRHSSSGEPADASGTRNGAIDEKGILYESVHKRSDDRPFPVEVHARTGRYGGRQAVFAVVRDVSARKETERRLEETTSKLDQVFETAADGMRIVDADFRVLRSNRTLREMSGSTLPDGAVTCYEAFSGDLCHTEGCPLKRVLAGEKRVEVEVDKKRADGTLITCILTATPFVVDGKVVGIVEDFKDISERRNAENLARHLATHDALTDLPNRLLFQDRLSVALAQIDRGGEAPALLFVDVDRFKEVNDAHGHRAGDLVLTTVARRLERLVRKVDTVARLGGDEFTVLLAGVESRDDAARVARKVLASMKEPMVADAEILNVSVSVGVALYRPGEDSDEMLSRADRAMYEVKERGGGSFEFASGANER